VRTTTIARAGLLLGLGASLAANVAHAVTHAGASGQDGAPVVAIAAAMFWPVALLATSELLFRLRFDRFAALASRFTLHPRAGWRLNWKVYAVGIPLGMLVPLADLPGSALALINWAWVTIWAFGAALGSGA